MHRIRAAGLFLTGAIGVEACYLDDISLGGAGGAGGTFPATTTSISTTSASTATTTSASTTSASTTATSASTTTGAGGVGGHEPSEICDDREDNDGDGEIDCADLDCSSVCQDSCGSVTVLTGSMTVEGDNFGAPSTLAASCVSESGPEVVYQIIAPFDGFLRVRLYSEPDLGISIRTNCPDDRSEITCVDAVAQRSTESLELPVSAGQAYFILIDAYAPGEVGQFSLSVDLETTPGESICDDLIDNDGDGLTDCEDPFDCGAGTGCTPGGVPVGAPCFAASECAANGAAPVCIGEARFGLPHGYCSAFCDDIGDACRSDGRCVAFSALSVRGLCFRRCTSRAECRPGYACADDGAGSLICVPEEQCDDGVDNDGDGARDCGDSGCAGFLGCVCAAAVPITLGTVTGDTTGGTTAIRGSCNREGDAPEDLYTFTPPATGTLTLTLTSATDQGIYVFGDCREPGSELLCVELVGPGVPETRRLGVSAGVPITIVVDGRYGPADAGPYALTLTLE